MRFIDFTGGSLPNHVLRIQNSILSGMLNADQGAWVSRQSHLRSQLSPFQATRIAVSSCPILRSAYVYDKLSPGSCDAVSADNRWVLRGEVVLAHRLWTPLNVALGIDAFVE